MMMTTLTSSRINDIHKKMVSVYLGKEQASRNPDTVAPLDLVNRRYRVLFVTN